jgi:mannose-6-phosphate isomerase-like protein (cupin superfamily)/quinol monooxygenase YgiN
MATVELVRFRVAPEGTDALLEARPAMLEAFRADREGFLGARLARLSEDEWLDIVDWRSPEDFAASRAKGANLPGIAAFFAVIDELISSEEGTPLPMGTPSVVGFDDLPQTEHAHEFVGADHGQVPFSIILVHAAPGAGPRLHRHPYPEVFVVESGEASFRLGDDTMVVGGGQIVVGPANVPHGFTNTGTEPLRLTAIHGAAAFATEWLTGPDTVWASNPKG